MLYRVIALLFALFVSVPAFAAAEAVGATTSASVVQVDAGTADALAVPGLDGTSDEHPLDDQTGQSLSESAMDPPALMMARPDAKAPLVTMSRARPYAMAAWRAPYLDGPQRPPCRAFVSA